MGYVGSYVWQLRQKVGDKKLLTTTVDVLPVDEAGHVKLIYAKGFDRWSTVGGHVEEGDSYTSAALQLNTNDATRQILTAYQRYNETGVVQMIEER